MGLVICGEKQLRKVSMFFFNYKSFSVSGTSAFMAISGNKEAIIIIIDDISNRYKPNLFSGHSPALQVDTII